MQSENPLNSWASNHWGALMLDKLTEKYTGMMTNDRDAAALSVFDDDVEIQSDSSTQLRLTTATSQGVHLLRVSGEVDISVKVEFRDALERAVAEANSPLVIDLSGVRYFDASAFSALVAAQKRMTARPDKLYIVVNCPIVRQLFSLLKLDTFFDLHVSAGHAVAAAVKDRDLR
jgi:anti-sigma B factor antagonist